LILLPRDPLRDEFNLVIMAEPKQTQADVLQMLGFGTASPEQKEHVESVATCDHRIAGEELLDRSYQAKKAFELAPRGRTYSVALKNLPETVCMVFFSIDDQVAAPPKSTSIVIEHAKQRMRGPNWTRISREIAARIEALKVLLHLS
jgi:hypothetical protein